MVRLVVSPWLCCLVLAACTPTFEIKPSAQAPDAEVSDAGSDLDGDTVDGDLDGDTGDGDTGDGDTLDATADGASDAQSPCVIRGDASWLDGGSADLQLCRCGVQASSDPSLIFDVGNALDAGSAFLGDRTILSTEHEWSLWDTASRIRIAWAREKLVAHTAAAFLTLGDGGLTVRDSTAGSARHTLSVASSDLKFGGVASDGSYGWAATTERLRAFSEQGTVWLDVPVDYDTTKPIAARPEGIYVWVAPETDSGRDGYLRSYARKDGAAVSLTVSGELTGWFEDLSHVVTKDIVTYIYNPDGSRAGLQDSVDLVSGLGDYVWVVGDAGSALYQLGKSDALSSFTSHRLLGPGNATVFLDGENPVYKLTPSDAGLIGAAVDAADPELSAQLAELAPSLGCGPIQGAAALNTERLAITTPAGYFVYDATARKLVSFTPLSHGGELVYADDGSTLAVRPEMDGGALQLYEVGGDAGLVASLSGLPEAFTLSADGQRLGYPPASVLDRTGSTVFQGKASSAMKPIAPILSPRGNALALRDDCATDCKVALYADGGLSGTVTGYPLQWLDDSTLVVRSSGSGRLRAIHADGSNAYGDGCAYTPLYQVPTPAAAFPAVQRLSATEIYVPNMATRCNLATGVSTSLPAREGAYPALLLGSHSVYATDGPSPASAQGARSLTIPSD